MTDAGLTAICLVVDRSGSMGSIRDDAQGGINAFLDDQRKATDRRSIRIVQFDHYYEVVTPTTPAASVPPYVLRPRGMTALHDAMGRGLTEFGAELAALPEDERPGRVIVAVMTDGHENGSQEYTADRVKEIINHQRDVYGWQILYLAANQDAILEASKYDIPAGNSLLYANTSRGVRGMAASLGGYVAQSVAMAAPASFTDEDRERAAAE